MIKSDTFHAINRFGLGASPTEAQHVGNDPRGWLSQQVKQAYIPQSVQTRHGGDRSELPIRVERPMDDEKTKGTRPREVYIKETGARLITQAQSDQPFIERMVLFWSNHFTVSIQKGLLLPLVNAYEAEAIRPHITGYFHDMLLSVCQHPVMLIYLDNSISTGNESKLGTRRKRGLNENLAREILELHTLGVNGGYTQQDVIALANIITGWGLARGRGGPIASYRFAEERHEPGDKILLNTRFKEDGEAEGIRALRMLATHPSTARHIATKLARHFVSDDPPESAIKPLEQAFLNSQGHLPTVMNTLINLQAAWEHPFTKFKTSYEYVVSALRLSQTQAMPGQAIRALEALNFRAFAAPSPAGYDDIAAAWMVPDALMKRIEWSYKMAQHMPQDMRPTELASAALGEALSDTTRRSIEAAPSAQDGFALLFTSPEFQRR